MSPNGDAVESKRSSDDGVAAPDASAELAQRSRPFLALFGSAAAVSTFLLFAGFLSDYGVYQLLGLPRLSFSLTALIEAGADTVIDTLALLFQGLRLGVLLLGLALVALVWANHEHPKLKPWARCRRLHSLAWFVVFLFSLFLLASVVDRAQRSLRGDMYQASSVARALQRAYADTFPDPEARRYALEREGFELNYYLLPNALLGLEHLLNPPKEELISGIALRVLPQSRADARHVYGWLVLSVIGLLVSLLMLRWWLLYLDTLDSVSQNLPNLGSDGQVSGPLPLWMQWWSHQRLGLEMAPVVQRLLTPLVWLMLAASILMLPLLHGVLARQSLGGQTMMVYLRPDGQVEKRKTKQIKKIGEKTGKEETKENEFEAQISEPSDLIVAKARFDCDAAQLNKLEKRYVDWQEALTDSVQKRFEEDATSHVTGALRSLADQVIASNCAEAVHTFRAAKPAAALLAQFDPLAQAYRQASLRVNSSYQVHQGVILAHPRDGQPLMLVENVVPRTDEQPGQWSVWAVPQERVLETVVTPDVLERSVHQAAQAIRQAPDEASNRLPTLLRPIHPVALRELLPLSQEGKLNANASGVAITALGGMVRASALDQPRLAAQGIQRLAYAAMPAAGAASAPDRTARQQGAAVTSLHLTNDPYAAALFAGMLEPPFDMRRCRKMSADLPLYCIPQSTTTAGYLLAALNREWQLMQPPSLRTQASKSPVMPDRFRDAEQRLQALLIAYIDDPQVQDDWRGAACSIVERVAGSLTLNADQANRFLMLLAPDKLGVRAFSAGACISASKRLGIPVGALRASLRQIVLDDTKLESLQQGEHQRFRHAALATLFEMGLASEQALMLKLVEQGQTDKALRSLVSKFLSEVEGQPMAEGLLQCATDERRPLQARAQCLEEFGSLERSYSGDEGVAKRLLDWARGSQDTGLKGSVCTALKALLDRDSKHLSRLKGEDATLDACTKESEATGTDAPGTDASQDRLRQLFEALKARPNEPGT